MASSIGDGVPRGKRVRLRAMVPCRTRVTSRRCASLSVPIGHMRVMSVVPKRYWPPESMSSRPSPSMTACASGVAR